MKGEQDKINVKQLLLDAIAIKVKLQLGDPAVAGHEPHDLGQAWVDVTDHVKEFLKTDG